MRSGRYVIAAVIFLLGLGVGIGVERHWLDTRGMDAGLPASETAQEHARKHLDPDYVCPMHPDVVSMEPGSCPICGMDLVRCEPVSQAASNDDGYPEVTVTPEFMHNFGVRTAAVDRGTVSRDILALGRISRMRLQGATDVTPGIKGRIRSVSDKAIGDSVNKGELLYSMDAPAWRGLQQSYLDALQATGKWRAKQLRQRLRSLGMEPAALSRLEREGQVEEVLDKHAPVDGTLVEWHAGKGDPVEAATKVVTLGGESRIPVVVNLLEGQGAWIERGQRVTVRVPTMSGTDYEGQVDRTDREINFESRTLPVYVSFSTADPRLGRGMLVEVTIHVSERENVLRIPREALIRTGEGDHVVLSRGEGRFQPVRVKRGLESGDYIQILSGVEEGQEVVVSGQFLIDSESNLMADLRRMEQEDDR